ncbi:MAG: lysylphosphatidylglycerol synthase domain-containing protein [Microthrixaceae bacterium]
MGAPAGNATRGLVGRGGEQFRTWRRTTFGPASEHPLRRRTSDAVALVLCVAYLVWAVPRHDDVSAAAEALASAFRALPDGFNDLVGGIYRLGSLWAAGLVVVAALVVRRLRLARDLAVAGAAAWLLARLIGELTSRAGDVSGAVSASVQVGSATPTFPSVRLAVVVAVIRTAAPYLTRSWRRVGAGLVVVTALGALYLGAALPNAVVAGMVLGWAVAAAVHLVAGSPGGRPTVPQVVEALDELGLPVHDARWEDDRPHELSRLAATDDSGPVLVRVLGRDEADAQLLSRAWHRLAYRSTPGRLHVSRIEEVEHQGYVLLRAQRAGVRVPELLVTGTAGPGAAVYAERVVPGRPLSAMSPEEITEDLLEAVWRQVALLHAGGIGHLSLTADRVVIAPDGPALVGFERGVASDPRSDRLTDVAVLLISTAELVGADRAVAAAAFGMGRDVLLDALPLVQTAVLPTSARATGRSGRKEQAQRIGSLRTVLAHALDTEPPHLTELHRLSGSTILMIVGTFLGVAALLSQVGDPATLWDTMAAADWSWIALAIAVSLSTNVATAVALMGSVPIRIPLARTTELQLSLTFANLAVPTVGGLAAQIRYLQKRGVDLAAAVTAGGVISGVANVTVTSAVCLVALLLSPAKLDLTATSADSLLGVLEIAAIVLGVVSAVVFGIPAIRERVLRPLRSGWRTVTSVLRSPRQVTQLVLGWAGNALLYALVLYCCVAAFGPAVNFWTVVLINTGVSTLAFAVPVPGGATAVSSVGVAGALTAVGVSQDVAVAASLAYQVTATFIPAVPGWFAFRNLLARDDL